MNNETMAKVLQETGEIKFKNGYLAGVLDTIKVVTNLVRQGATMDKLPDAMNALIKHRLEDR